jgi:hypothetical protein
MKSLSRRRVLKQLVSLPFAGASALSLLACNHQHHTPSLPHTNISAPPQARLCDARLAGPSNPGLNVFLHGLFLISSKNGLFDLYTPNVGDHAYKAGRWRAEKDLLQGSAISLSGVNAGAMPVFSSTSHFIIQNNVAATLDSTKSYFSSFQLPFPDISSPPLLHRILSTPAGYSGFFAKDSQHDDLGMVPTSIPLVYIFVYPQTQFKGDTKDVNLIMTYQGIASPEWTYAPDPNDPLTYDLHIHASPNKCMDATHLPIALSTMSAMFTPSLTLALNYPEGSIPSGKGCEEDESLEDRVCPHKSKGGEIANCMAFILGS